jgi:hypothetical protein
MRQPCRALLSCYAFFRSDGGNYGFPESLRRAPVCRGFFVYGGIRIESFV